MRGPTDGAAAPLAHYCTQQTACNRLVAASRPTTHPFARETSSCSRPLPGEDFTPKKLANCYYFACLPPLPRQSTYIDLIENEGFPFMQRFVELLELTKYGEFYDACSRSPTRQ